MVFVATVVYRIFCRPVFQKVGRNQFPSRRNVWLFSELNNYTEKGTESAIHYPKMRNYSTCWLRKLRGWFRKSGIRNHLQNQSYEGSQNTGKPISRNKREWKIKYMVRDLIKLKHDSFEKLEHESGLNLSGTLVPFFFFCCQSRYSPPFWKKVTILTWKRLLDAAYTVY